MAEPEGAVGALAGAALGGEEVSLTVTLDDGGVHEECVTVHRSEGEEHHHEVVVAIFPLDDGDVGYPTTGLCVGLGALHLGDVLAGVVVLQGNLHHGLALMIDAPGLLTLEVDHLLGIGQRSKLRLMMQSEEHRYLGTFRGPVTEGCIFGCQSIQQFLVIGVDDYVEVGNDTMLAQFFTGIKN